MIGEICFLGLEREMYTDAFISHIHKTKQTPKPTAQPQNKQPSYNQNRSSWPQCGVEVQRGEEKTFLKKPLAAHSQSYLHQLWGQPGHSRGGSRTREGQMWFREGELGAS